MEEGGAGSPRLHYSMLRILRSLKNEKRLKMFDEIASNKMLDKDSGMRALLFMVLILLTGCNTMMAEPEVNEEQNQATYTITGTKDPRLDAWFLASYVSQDPYAECTYKNIYTGGRRSVLSGRGIKVEDGNYSIEFPLKVVGDCDYRFRKLELVMKRKYDEDLASIHPILSDRKKVRPIYWKTKGGAMGNGSNPQTPSALFTTKKYFRIAKGTTFLCKTFWFPERRNRTKGRITEAHSSFHCTMQINSDVNRTLYKKAPEAYWFSHPAFGVDELKDETMQVDILVDEKNCKTLGEKLDRFRELEEPNLWQKLF